MRENTDMINFNRPFYILDALRTYFVIVEI